MYKFVFSAAFPLKYFIWPLEHHNISYIIYDTCLAAPPLLDTTRLQLVLAMVCNLSTSIRHQISTKGTNKCKKVKKNGSKRGDFSSTICTHQENQCLHCKLKVPWPAVFTFLSRGQEWLEKIPFVHS